MATGHVEQSKPGWGLSKSVEAASSLASHGRPRNRLLLLCPRLGRAQML
jgi:hypothetical protein